MPAFVVRNSPVRLGLLTALAAGFFALSCWYVGMFGATRSPDDEWVGWLGMVLAGIGGIVLLRRWIAGGDQIVVDDHGVLWRQWSDVSIPWSAIRGVEIRKFQHQSFVCLNLHGRRQHASTRLIGKLAGLNRLIGFGDVPINVNGTDTTAAKLSDTIRARLRG